MPDVEFSSRHVHLALSDFEADPVELSAELGNLGAKNVLALRKGDTTRTGRPILKSQLWVLHGFDATVIWEGAIDGLVASLGGFDRLDRLLLRIGAKDQYVHFQLPIRRSPLQEQNYLPTRTLDLLLRLRLWVGFDFSDFNPSDPTHLSENDPNE